MYTCHNSIFTQLQLQGRDWAVPANLQANLQSTVYPGEAHSTAISCGEKQIYVQKSVVRSLHFSVLAHIKSTHRELYSSVYIKSCSVEPGRVGRLSLALDAARIAGHRAVPLVHLLAVFAHHSLHHHKVDCWVSRSANLKGKYTAMSFSILIMHDHIVEAKLSK